MPHLKQPSSGQAIKSDDTDLEIEYSTSDEENVRKLDARGIANYFLGFWNSRHASEAMKRLEDLERRNNLQRLRQEYGCWRPPPEMAELLKKPQSMLPDSSPLTNDKETRNLKFVLKMLGCSLHGNRPMKQFFKAQSYRQKRYWLYKYLGPAYSSKAEYQEPICPTRLKRLYHFFPDRFQLDGNNVFFNSQLLTYDQSKNVFFAGIVQTDDSDVSMK